jgi:hypothetical protein
LRPGHPSTLEIEEKALGLDALATAIAADGAATRGATADDPMAGNEDRDWIRGHSPTHGPRGAASNPRNGLITDGLAGCDTTDG